MYYTNTASLAGLFILLLDKEAPALQPAVRITTTAEKMGAFLPDALLACISPSGSGSAKSKGGRPKKQSETATDKNRGQKVRAEQGMTDESPGNLTSGGIQTSLTPGKPLKDPASDGVLQNAAASSRISWQKSSYLPFLYNAYKNAHARREEMARVLRRNPVSILLEAEKKAQSVLYRNGSPCFDEKRLEKALTDPSCIPVKAKKEQEQYIGQIRFYMRTNPEKALSRAFLALLLAEQCESCLDILFPAVEYSADAKKSPILYADELARNGQTKEAKDLYQAVLNDPKSTDRAKAALRLGRLYRYHYHYETAGHDAYALFTRSLELAPDDPLPDALYELYLCERDGIGTVRNSETDKSAFRHLLNAAEGGCLPALLEIGGMYYLGNERFSVTADKEKALACYRAGAEKGDPACETMTGKCLEEKELFQEARYWYFKAAKQGNIDASLRLAELDLLVPLKPLETNVRAAPLPAVSKPEAGLCFFNTQNEMAQVFVSSLPAGWQKAPFQIFETYLQSFTTDKSGIKYGNAKMTHPGRIIVFLSDEDTDRNLKGLDRAIAFLENLPMEGSRKKDLIERIHFYLRTEGDDSIAVKMTDSFNSVNELRQSLASVRDTAQLLPAIPRRNWFYHIRICNPQRDASQYLLSRMPLFLPALAGRRRQPHVLILGSGTIVPKLITDILSVFPYNKDGKPLPITVLAENAGSIREKLEEQMPELLVPKSPLSCDLHFFDLPEHEIKIIFTQGFQNRPAGAGKTGNQQMNNTTPLTDTAEKELRQILNEANYYIVAGDNDAANAENAAFLRSALLSAAMDFENLPVIAVYVRDDLLSRHASHFSVLGEGIGFSWYNNYNLFCFGSNSQLYTFQELEEGCMEQRAFALHRSYYSSDENAVKQASADYWCRFYNRDSSHMSALSAIYKAYLAGVTLKDPQGYGQAAFESRLAEPMAEFLADPQHLNDAARGEHRRWISFICSRGWRHATMEQMKAYLQQGNPRQQLYLAKLHPCITGWQQLPEVERVYNEVQRQRNPEWKDRSFRQSDFDIVKLLPDLLQMQRS